MKKLIVLILAVTVLTGCQISTESLNQELSTKINEHLDQAVYPDNNVYRQNYSYYLPVNADIEDRYLTNDVIKVSQSKIYLFVDLYSYKNEISINYRLNLPEVYSEEITTGENTFEIVAYEYGSKYIVFATNEYARMSTSAKVGYLPDIVETMVSVMSTIEVNDRVVLAEEVNVETPIIETIDIFKSKVEEDTTIDTKDDEDNEDE
jgi:hypothetical protein